MAVIVSSAMILNGRVGFDTKLDQINESTSTIPLLSERLTKVEESSKQAHKRIDEIIKLK